MKILIVEDGKDKRQSIKKVILETGDNSIEVAKTYFSAKNKIITMRKEYDMVILDMFLPDAKDDEERKGLAGKDLIFDIMSEGIEVPILVVTQYTEYVNNMMPREQKNREFKHMIENKHYGKDLDDDIVANYDCTYYEGLHEYLEAKAPIYLGIIFYSNQFKEWIDDLKYFINKVKGDM